VIRYASKSRLTAPRRVRSSHKTSDCPGWVDAPHVDGILQQMIECPKTVWFRIQALQCIGLALRAKDPRIKRLYVLAAKQWLGLAQPEAYVLDDHHWDTNYRGVERRMAARHQGPKKGLILLGPDVFVACTVRDFSAAGVGLFLPNAIVLPAEFDLTFDHAKHHCITVWRRPRRIGLEFRSIH
jgi:hypothetical protein